MGKPVGPRVNQMLSKTSRIGNSVRDCRVPFEQFTLIYTNRESETSLIIGAGGNDQMELTFSVWEFSEFGGVFHSTKNSDLKFRKFHVPDGTVIWKFFGWLRRPCWTEPFHSVSDGNFQKRTTERYWEPKFFRMEQYSWYFPVVLIFRKVMTTSQGIPKIPGIPSHSPLNPEFPEFLVEWKVPLDYLSKNPVFFGNFPFGKRKLVFPFTSQRKFPDFLGKL